MSSPWQCLATIGDASIIGLPTQANPKPAAEQRRVLTMMSCRAAPYLRKRYGLPLALEVTGEAVTSAAGTATVQGTATGDAADVRIEVVAGGAVSGGAVTVRLSRDNGVAGTWGATTTLPADGVVTVDGVTVTLAGTWAAGEAVTYTAGPDPGVRWAVAALASHAMYYNRGGDPKAMEPYKDARDQAMDFVRVLAKGEDAELDQTKDATPSRAEGGPLWVATSRAAFLGRGS